MLSWHNEVFAGCIGIRNAILDPAMEPLSLTPSDRVVAGLDLALRSITGTPRAVRTRPAAAETEAPLDAAARRRSGALMRVNHVGEVCAQALYSAQALATPNPELRRQFAAAAAEETDHLAWTAERLHELGARPSLLNPLWYLGAFGIGLVAGRMGDAASLGFVVETERQVERHLESHLERLPDADQASRAVVTQMKLDEARHGAQAQAAGAETLPRSVRQLMRLAARVMTTTAHHV